MTDSVSAFQLAIPPNGSIGSIFFVDCELGWSNVTRILITFPPGCAGQVGVRVEMGGAQVYPLTPGTFFVFDDFTLELDVSGQGNSGQWHFAGYNTDVYQHVVTAYFFYDFLTIPPGGQRSPLISL